MSTVIEDTTWVYDEEFEGEMREQDDEALLTMLEKRYEQAMREGTADNVDEVFDRIKQRLKGLE
jgi:hypothetical protein